MPEQFELTTNDLTTYEFTGDKIGFASTRTRDSLRWTDIGIYKTSSGRYIVERLGRSLVYHLADSDCASSGEEITGAELAEESEPCEKCDPPTPEDSDFDSGEVFRQEVTISRVDVVDEPREIREVLTVSNQGRRPYLSSVAFSAIQEAVRNDQALIGVFERKVRVD